MTKREKIFNKYNGLCAYTGKPLDDLWQIDHMTSKFELLWEANMKKSKPCYNNIDNLVPTLRIVNHYKRSLNLESFRLYMLSFHIRLSKLPKKTSVQRTKDRITYLQKVADAFDISQDKPFSGQFYFETL